MSKDGKWIFVFRFMIIQKPFSVSVTLTNGSISSPSGLCDLSMCLQYENQGELLCYTVRKYCRK